MSASYKSNKTEWKILDLFLQVSYDLLTFGMDSLRTAPLKGLRWWLTHKNKSNIFPLAMS